MRELSERERRFMSTSTAGKSRSPTSSRSTAVRSPEQPEALAILEDLVAKPPLADPKNRKLRLVKMGIVRAITLLKKQAKPAREG